MSHNEPILAEYRKIGAAIVCHLYKLNLWCVLEAAIATIGAAPMSTMVGANSLVIGMVSFGELGDQG